MVIVVLLAAGTGNRFRNSTPKQLAELDGKPLIEHSLEVFYQHNQIDEINIVVSKELISRVSEISQPYATKVKQITEGGNTRSESSFAGLVSIGTDTNPKILIHDAARPFISSEMISECIEALDVFDAVSMATPSNETVFEVEEGIISRIPNRERLMRAQTPQGFRLETIIAGYERMKADDTSFTPTDDCGVVEKYLPEIPIGVIRGPNENIKITFPKDLHLAQAILEADDKR
ncbi:MAG: 2-C-methyl-D-erythritol 4-phosphate cytidylyltransferase [Acidimicrobiaceae bacterium]|jgi:2-C-methyl-D-erythritol 4-phosphate cytidylyltransferase|nr:2-C-methyl-D-erythritol 4-phosphate cytidylyltransferase [Acidimicrobiaceae bacterium]|tara:strand:+ start:296 stop:994 length:699 start_codon:yes stop_codon:yes gene_type:complete